MSQVKPQKSRKKLIQITWIIAVFLFLVVVPQAVGRWIGVSKIIAQWSSLTFDQLLQLAALYTIQQAVTLSVCALAVMFLFRRSLLHALRELGLNGNFKTGWLVGFVVSLPMLIIPSVIGHATINSNVLLQVIAFGIITGFGEEILFRGFAFGLLYQRVRLGFWLSVILPTIIFAIGHLYQAHGIASSLDILTVTALGSVWFAWLYVRWEYNLWVPISIHAFMDSWFFVFGANNSVLGNTTLIVDRGLAILLSIILTLWHCHWDLRKTFVNIRPQEVSPLSTMSPPAVGA